MPKWQLTPEQRAAMPAVCSGAFVAPPRNYADAHLAPDEAPCAPPPMNPNGSTTAPPSCAAMCISPRAIASYLPIRWM
ncbi:hypothetical protein [Microbulbifer taiwanensis]|uniref:hypothetical protein n=1 Tax=Microbulbifer taiwanensis TaxID=986746 RepID=UPI00361D43B2